MYICTYTVRMCMCMRMHLYMCMSMSVYTNGHVNIFIHRSIDCVIAIVTS